MPGKKQVDEEFEEVLEESRDAGQKPRSDEKKVTLYENLVLESVEETRRLSRRVETLLKHLEQASEELNGGQAEELLKALAESNIVILEKLKDLGDREEEEISKMRELQERLSKLLGGESEGLGAQVSQLKESLKDLHSEVREMESHELETIKGVKAQHDAMQARLEKLLAQVQSSPEKKQFEAQTREAIQKSREVGKKLEFLETEALENFREKLEETQTGLFALRDRMRKTLAADDRQLVDFSLAHEALAREASGLYGKMHKLRRGEEFALELEKLSKGVQDAQRELAALKAKSVAVKGLAASKTERNAMEKALKVKNEAEKALQKRSPELEGKIHELHEKVQQLESRLSGARPDRVKKHLENAKMERKKLEELHDSVKKGKVSGAEAGEELKVSAERLRRPLDSGEIVHKEFEEQAAGLEERARELKGLEVVGEHEVKALAHKAQELGEKLHVSKVSAATGGELKPEGVGRLYDAVSLGSTEVVSEEHSERLQDAKERLLQAVDQVKSLKERQKPLEEEYSKIADISKAIEKKARAPSEAAKELQELGKTSSASALQRLSSASKSVEAAGAPEELKKIITLRVEASPEKFSEKAAQYVKGLEGSGEKRFSLLEIARVLGVEKEYAAENLENVLKALGPEYQARNSDFVSRLQKKEIFIEKK